MLPFQPKHVFFVVLLEVGCFNHWQNLVNIIFLRFWKKQTTNYVFHNLYTKPIKFSKKRTDT